MIKLKTFIVILILITSLLILNPNINSSPNIRQSPGDWVITKPTNIQNQIKIINGNLTVLGTGKLILDNVTLVMNCSFDGQYYIEVRSYGELNILNNSTIKSYNSTFRYDFYYLENSLGIISNSTIMNVGWDYFAGSHGLLLGTDFIVVDNCTFNYNYIDIWCEASDPLIKNNKIITKCIGKPGEHFQMGGIYLWHNPNPIIVNNYIANSKYGIDKGDDTGAIVKNNILSNILFTGITIGQYISDGKLPIVKNNIVQNCNEGGISLGGKIGLVENNTVINCKIGIDFYRATGLISNCTIINSSKCDIHLYRDSNVKLLNLTFDKEKIIFENWYDTKPNLILQWYLKINIKNCNNISITNANVIIKNSKETEIFNGSIDSNSYTKLINCTEYFQQDMNNDNDGYDQGEKDYHTPHNISIILKYKNGFYTFYQDVFMDKSKNITMKIDIDNLPPDLILSSNDIEFSNNRPMDGDMIVINASIHNQGKTAVNKAEIKFYYDIISNENQIGNTQNIMNLNPNEESQIFTIWNTTNKVGNHTIFVVINNSNPGELNNSNNIAFKNITINPRNQIPIAVLVVNKTIIFENEEITIDGSNSYDPDGYIDKYNFDFGDGNNSNWIPNNTLTYKYHFPGTYIIKLKVKDNKEDISVNIAKSEIIVNKKNNAPIIKNISINSSIIEPNESLNISVDAFDDDGDNLKYIYETDNGTITGSGSIVIWHAPTSEGKYTIIIKVYDGKLYSKSEVIQITVKKNNIGPIIINITANPIKIEPGDSSIIKVNAIDPDTNDSLNYFYNATNGFFSGSGAIVTWHAPDLERTYIITVTVKDLSGKEAKDTISIIVAKGEDKNEKNLSVNEYILTFFIIVIIISIIIFYSIIKKSKTLPNKSNEQGEKESIEVKPVEEIENGD
jgi:parallel beta-helix repeat protein